MNLYRILIDGGYRNKVFANQAQINHYNSQVENVIQEIVKRMLVTSETARIWPKFTDYVYRSFPNVLNSKTIVQNMAIYGKLTKSRFANYVSPGHYPIVDFGDKLWPGCTAYTYDVADLNGNYPPTIELSMPMIVRFNENPHDPRNMFTTSSGQRVPSIGGMMLSLLCELGNIEAGFKWEDRLTWVDAFEIQTYGVLVRWYC